MDAVIHLFFETLAYFIGYRLYQFLNQKNGNRLSSRKKLALLVCAGLCAFFISRLGIFLEEFFYFIGTAQSCRTGKTIVGGFIGGLFGIEIGKCILRIKGSTGDYYTYPIIIGLIIGRLGCHFSGTYDCTYGDIIGSQWWGWNFGDGYQRIPWQLYEIFFLFVFLFFLKVFQRKILSISGLSFKIFLVSYLAFRFIVDFWKPLYRDPQNGLAATQWLSLLGLSYYLFIFAKWSISAIYARRRQSNFPQIAEIPNG